jgi:hypothetical protein
MRVATSIDAAFDGIADEGAGVEQLERPRAVFRSMGSGRCESVSATSMCQ